jgi:hypothetical protein
MEAPSNEATQVLDALLDNCDADMTVDELNQQTGLPHGKIVAILDKYCRPNNLVYYNDKVKPRTWYQTCTTEQSSYSDLVKNYLHNNNKPMSAKYIHEALTTKTKITLRWTQAILKYLTKCNTIEERIINGTPFYKHRVHEQSKPKQTTAQKVVTAPAPVDTNQKELDEILERVNNMSDKHASSVLTHHVLDLIQDFATQEAEAKRNAEDLERIDDLVMNRDAHQPRKETPQQETVVLDKVVKPPPKKSEDAAPIVNNDTVLVITMEAPTVQAGVILDYLLTSVDGFAVDELHKLTNYTHAQISAVLYKYCLPHKLVSFVYEYDNYLDCKVKKWNAICGTQESEYTRIVEKVLQVTRTAFTAEQLYSCLDKRFGMTLVWTEYMLDCLVRHNRVVKYDNGKDFLYQCNTDIAQDQGTPVIPTFEQSLAKIDEDQEKARKVFIEKFEKLIQFQPKGFTPFGRHTHTIKSTSEILPRTHTNDNYDDADFDNLDALVDAIENNANGVSLYRKYKTQSVPIPTCLVDLTTANMEDYTNLAYAASDMPDTQFVVFCKDIVHQAFLEKGSKAAGLRNVVARPPAYSHVDDKYFANYFDIVWYIITFICNERKKEEPHNKHRSVVLCSPAKHLRSMLCQAYVQVDYRVVCFDSLDRFIEVNRLNQQ